MRSLTLHALFGSRRLHPPAAAQRGDLSDDEPRWSGWHESSDELRRGLDVIEIDAMPRGGMIALPAGVGR